MIRRLVLLAAVAASAAAAQGADPLPSPVGLTFAQEGDGPLSTLLRLRDAEGRYRAAGEGSARWSQYQQVRASEEAAVGDHAAALLWYDASMGRGRDSVGVLPAGARAVGAADYIAARADTARVVMINEAHHDASSRLLTLDLLPLLYERGFRYLAAEAFNVGDVALDERGYPVDSSGFYTSETVFAALVREAARLGYTLVPYEIEHADEPAEDTLSRQQRRDYEQARHLAERTIGIDPDARVLVHAGYAHVDETPTEYWTPMAYYFRQRTGIDPLTVNQTRLGEASAPRYEHPAYRAADAAGLLRDGPVILLAADGQPLAPARASTDLQVFRPRAGDVDGRPAWLARLPGRTALSVDVPPCPQTCEVFARGPDEDVAAVPLDRLASGGGPVTLYVPPGRIVVTVRDGRTGEVLRREALDVPAL